MKSEVAEEMGMRLVKSEVGKDRVRLLKSEVGKDGSEVAKEKRVRLAKKIFPISHGENESHLKPTS